jgi:hypothetical protein
VTFLPRHAAGGVRDGRGSVEAPRTRGNPKKQTYSGASEASRSAFPSGFSTRFAIGKSGIVYGIPRLRHEKSRARATDRYLQTNVEQLFDLDHASRFDQIESALRAMGKKLEVTISDAA